MLLSEVPFEDLRIGQVVRRTDNGAEAWIFALNAERLSSPRPMLRRPRYDEVFMQHKNGNESSGFQMVFSNFELTDKILTLRERMSWTK